MLLPAAAADVEEDLRLVRDPERRARGRVPLGVPGDARGPARRSAGETREVHGEIRRHLLKRFPHVVFYRVVDGKVVVLACFPASRAGLSGRRAARASRISSASQAYGFLSDLQACAIPPAHAFW